MKTSTILLLCVVLTTSCYEKKVEDSTYISTLSILDNINILSNALYRKNYIDISGFTGHQVFRKTELNTVISGTDSLLRGFCGYEKRCIVKNSDSSYDTNPCFRLYMQFDSIISRDVYDFKVAERNRNFEDNIMRKVLGKKYKYFPKPLVPEIVWGTVVFPDKCIDVSIHTYPLCQWKDKPSSELISETLQFMTKRKFDSKEVDSLVNKFNRISDHCRK